jgi:tape measure domain-containing protein
VPEASDAVWLAVLPDMSRFGAEMERSASTAADSAGRKAGGRFESGFGGMLKKSAVGIGLAAGGLLAGALTSGIGRLTNIENATSTLEGLGHSAEAVTAIMNDALASVKGTSFGLDEAATIAVSAVASGVKPGQDLQRTLGLVADTASIAGVSLADMGSIFNGIAASGAISGQEINQLADQGIPALQWLADMYGVTAEAASEMVSEGKVSFADFQRAVETNIGGAALTAGNTTSGAFANMGAALARFGASLLTGVFPIAREVFGGLTGFLDAATARVGPLAEAMTADLLAAATSTFGFFRNTVIPALRDVKGWVQDNAGTIGFLTAAVTALALPYIASVVAINAQVAAFLVQNAVMRGAAVITRAYAAAQALLNAALFANPIGLVLVALVALAAGLVVAYRRSDEFRAVVDNAWKVIREAVAVAWDGYIRPALIAFAGFITGTLVPAVEWFWRNVIVPAFAGISTAVQWAWANVIQPALRALWSFINDVLAPVVMWLWNNVVKPAFAGISFAVQVAWNVVKLIFDAWVFYLQTVLAPVVRWLWENVVGPVFNAISNHVSWVWNNGIKPVFEALGGFIRDHVAPAFTTGVNAIGAAWDRIKELARAPINFVIDTVYNNGIRAGFEALARAVGSDARLPRMDTVGAPAGNANAVTTSNVRARAKGGFTPPGMTLVGEEGPELVDFKAPGRVYTAADTQKMLQRQPGTGDFFDDVVNLGKSAVRKGTDVVVGAADMLSNPFKFLRDKIAGTLQGIGGGDLGRIVAAIPRKMLDTIKTKVESFFTPSVEGGATGAIGTGAGGGGWQWQMAVLRQVFPGLALNSGFRPGAITATGNPSMHGRGRAVDVPPRMDVFNWIKANYGANTQELIFSPAGGGQIHRGKPHMYTGITRAMHFDHVHWGYDRGGVLPPGVSQVVNSTRQPEAILNPQQWRDVSTLAARGATGRGDVNFNGPLQALDTRALASEVVTLIRRDEALRGV